MKIDIITIFPEFFSTLDISLLKKAQEKKLLDISVTQLRDFATDKHKSVDDTPTGGGPGMVMTPTVWGKAIDHVISESKTMKPALIIPTPSGVSFTHELSMELSKKPWIIYACGRYEGIDARVAEFYRQEIEVYEISIGNYIVSGGEVAAQVIIEATTRLQDGFLGNRESILDESFAKESRRVEAPVYTRPSVWRGLSIPEVLLSGDHKKIQQWKEEMSNDISKRLHKIEGT